ncbi:MAG: peptide-methionine (R)-S-oxide reductase MsrB [bacterium]|nr:peptide-methionine (R)-S-oxide reductase MsrB [bacterium]
MNNESPDAPESTNEELSLEKITKTDKEWRDQLTDEQFRVARKEGTERAFTGKYWDNKKPGVYECVCCGLPLFDAETKYESGTGWPSFWKPIDEKYVGEKRDVGFLSVRTEVHCARCEAHLGHVFNDGPVDKTGLRYCLNSAALNFEEQSDKGE